MSYQKFYLYYSYQEPLHPEKIYGQAWETGLAFYGSLVPSNKSLDEWKKRKNKKI